jgi:hypothetical protein
MLRDVLFVTLIPEYYMKMCCAGAFDSGGPLNLGPEAGCSDKGFCCFISPANQMME